MPVTYQDDGEEQQPQGGRVTYDDQPAPKQQTGVDQALGIGAAGVLGGIGGAIWRKKFPGVSFRDASAFLGKLHDSISKEIDEGGLPAMYRDFKEYVRAAKAADPDARVPNLADYIHSRSANAAPQTADLLAKAQYAGPNSIIDNMARLEKPRLPAQIAADARAKDVPADVATFSASGAPQKGRDPLSTVLHLGASFAMPEPLHGFAYLRHLGLEADDPMNLVARSGNRALFEEPRFNLDGDYVPNSNVESFVEAQDAPARVRALKAIMPSSAARTGAVAGMTLGAGANGQLGDPFAGTYLEDDQQGQ